MSRFLFASSVLMGMTLSRKAKAETAGSFYDLKAKDIDLNEVDFASLKDKVRRTFLCGSLTTRFVPRSCWLSTSPVHEA